MKGKKRMELAPVRVPRKRDGADVLIYNEARTLPGADALGPLRISIWDNGTATDRREDASSSLRILAEEPTPTGKRFELTITIQQLKLLVADSAVLSATIADGVVALDKYERLHTRVHAALGMQFDPHLAMQLGIHLLSRVVINADDTMGLIDPVSHVEAPADARAEFWDELESKSGDAAPPAAATTPAVQEDSPVVEAAAETAPVTEEMEMDSELKEETPDGDVGHVRAEPAPKPEESDEPEE